MVDGASERPNHDRTISVRVSHEQVAEFDAAARRADLSLSVWMRHAAREKLEREQGKAV